MIILCHAGRGRSGTMTAIIQGMVAGITKTSELVDLIGASRVPPACLVRGSSVPRALLWAAGVRPARLSPKQPHQHPHQHPHPQSHPPTPPVTMRESRDGVLENPGHVAYVRNILGLQNTVPYKTKRPDAASPPLLAPRTLAAWAADQHRRWRRSGVFNSAWAHLASFLCGMAALYALLVLGVENGGAAGGRKRRSSSPKAKGS